MINMSESLWALFGMTFASEDLAYASGLFWAQSGTITWWQFLVFYSAGVLIGDLVLYVVGSISKRLSTTNWGRRWLPAFLLKTPKTDYKEKEFGAFERFLLLTRFIPGTRVVTYLYCGWNSYSLSSFLSILLVSTMLFALSGLMIVSTIYYGVAQELNLTAKIFVSLSSLVVANLFFRFFYLCYSFYQTFGEVMRPLGIVIRRLWSLEFWSTWKVYLPFVPYFVYLLFRFRPSSLLAANPGIRYSGLLGELKSDIDEQLLPALKRQRLAVHRVPENDFHKALQLMKKETLNYPVIVKPDSGMRGTGVKKVSNEEQLKIALASSKKKMVLQDFYDFTQEWGVYYVRPPGQEQGELFSITVKDRPKVIGDGKNSLFELVLGQKDYRSRVDLIFQHGGKSPLFVPKKGEKVELVDRGSHSKGCVFRDGHQWMTSPEAEAVRKTLDQLPGFHIGRVDIGFKSTRDLLNQDFRILEINGVGGESSNMYDPYLSKKKAYGIMCAQWRLIFEIGHQNLKSGSQNHESVWKLLQTLYLYRRQKA